MFNHATAIGIDIGRNFIKIAVINIGGEILSEKIYPLQKNQSKEYIIEIIVVAIAEIRRAVAIDGVNPMCVGIAAKGFIDHITGFVSGPDQGITGWNNVPLAKIISNTIKLPVFVGNDANMMTIAEHQFGVAKGFQNVIFIALRTGIGGGIIINGKLYRGVNNSGGEIGQMIIKYDGEISNTGIRGSFEHYASASAIVRRYYEVSGIQTEKKISGKDIFELSYAQDKTAMIVVKENAELVGVGLANLITIFAPEIIVIGGGMAEADKEYFDLIKKSAFANSLENCRTKVLIERALLGCNASLMGCVFYSLTRLAGKELY